MLKEEAVLLGLSRDFGILREAGVAVPKLPLVLYDSSSDSLVGWYGPCSVFRAKLSSVVI